MLSPVLAYLRNWWLYAHSQQLMLNGGWLLSGQRPINPISTRQLGLASKAAAYAVDIEKRVSKHTLRHSFAAHLLGHTKLETTALCA